MIPADLYTLAECEYVAGWYRCPECGGQLYPSHNGRARRCRADGCWNVLVTNDSELRAKYGPQEVQPTRDDPQHDANTHYQQRRHDHDLA